MGMRLGWRGAHWALGLTLSAALMAAGQTPSRGPGAPATSTSSSTGPQPKLEYAPREFNFGEIWVGMPAKIEITLKNEGQADLLLSASAECGCTVLTQPKGLLTPGETTSFSITYDTKRIGPVKKHVTLTTNDPTQRQVTLAVTGTVKPPFESTPADQLQFAGVLTDELAERSIRMRNQFGRPLKLKLKAGQEFDRFEVMLVEVEAGQVYELQAKTKPPLATGYSRVDVLLETDNADIPTLTVPVMSVAQPRVSVNPASLYVSPAATQPSQQIVTVQYRLESPLEITAVQVNGPGIEAELMPAGPAASGDKFGIRRVRVTLPPAEGLTEGAKIEILTTAKSEEYRRLVVPIVKRVTPAAAARPGATPPTSAAPVVPAPAPQPAP